MKIDMINEKVVIQAALGMFGQMCRHHLDTYRHYMLIQRGYITCLKEMVEFAPHPIMKQAEVDSLYTENKIPQRYEAWFKEYERSVWGQEVYDAV